MLAQIIPLEVHDGIVEIHEAIMTTFEAGKATELVAHYTEDGQLFPPNSDVIRGREAIAQFWQNMMNIGIKRIDLRTVEVEGCYGKTATEIGMYMAFDNADVLIDRGNYLIIWKQVDDAWQLHRDMWNSNLSGSPV